MEVDHVQVVLCVQTDVCALRTVICATTKDVRSAPLPMKMDVLNVMSLPVLLEMIAPVM